MQIQKSESLNEVVADQIRAAILDGRYPAGQWLRQEHIAHELKVSQMPVRVALKQLAAEGLVEHVPYRGVRVSGLSVEDIEDLYSARAFLESRAAAIAAVRITPEELAELRQVQAQLARNTAPADVLKYRDLNRRFHELIFTASRRSYLIRTLRQLWGKFPTMLIGNFTHTASVPLIGRDKVDIVEHEAIVTALERHDPEEARKAMYAHIASVLHEFILALQQHKNE